MANLWTKFKELIPSDTLQVGEVVQIIGDKSEIRLPSNEVVWVSGSSVAIGKNAYFKGGEITQEAPNLTVENITVY